MARNAGTGDIARDRPVEEHRRQWLRKFLSGVVGVAALCVSAVVLMHTYGEARLSSSGRALTVIKADPGPFKVKPDSPGGREIPDRDKWVYDRIAAAPAGRPVERLLPVPEVPLPPPKVERSAVPEPAAKDPAPAAAVPETKTAPAAPKPGAGTAKATAPPAREDRYRLQLAALRSKTAVDKAWKRLQRQHRDLLSGLRLAIEKKDLGPPKGIYFRLLAGPVADRETARRICVDLVKRNVGCLVVRR